MKKVTFLILSVLFLMACNGSKSTEEIEKGNQELELARIEIERLKQESNKSHGAMQELITSLQDIDDNLSEIRKSRRDLTMESQEIESVEETKERIQQSMDAIAMIMEENRKKIKGLRYELNNSSDSIGQLNKIIGYWENELLSKNDEIRSLRDEIADLSIENLEIFDAYLEKADEADVLEDRLNTAFFAYGSSKELKEAGVITKEGGFVGMGKIEKLKEDFNKEYFKKIDIEVTKSFPLEGKKVTVVTNHPSGSYSIDIAGESKTLRVIDAEEFWSASKYLVVVVD